jgi:hypothetical protein
MPRNVEQHPLVPAIGCPGIVAAKQIPGALGFAPFHNVSELFYHYCLCMLPVCTQFFHTAPRLDGLHDIENSRSACGTARHYICLLIVLVLATIAAAAVPSDPDNVGKGCLDPFSRTPATVIFKASLCQEKVQGVGRMLVRATRIPHPLVKPILPLLDVTCIGRS